jgi:hypothetical protein
MKISSLALALVCLAAAACGGSASTAAPTAAPVETEAAAAEAETAPTGTAESAAVQAGAVAIPARKASRVPDDVPAHLSLSLGGGGGPENCVDIASLPEAGGAPREALTPSGRMVWCYCGLKESPGTAITGTLSMPDGSRVALEGAANAYPGFDGACVDFWHDFSVVPPRAPHAFEVDVSGRRVIDSFVPVVGRFVFAGFQPGEEVRIIVYAMLQDDAGPEFVADARSQADGDGRLVVDVGEPGDPWLSTLVYAVGQATPCRMYTTAVPLREPMSSCDGEAGFDNPIRGWTYDAPAPTYVYWKACPDAPRSGLHAGDRALVTKRLDELPVFAEAGRAAEIIDYIPAFEEVEVRDGPGCADGIVWWQVAAPALNVVGWVPEREDESSAFLLRQGQP